MRAKYLPFVKGLLNNDIGRLSHPEPERPLGGIEILCLHRAKPTHHLDGFLKLGRRQLLIVESC